MPYLRVGWNRQFIMMREFGFVYDSSMAAPFSNPPIWPYTLDYKMPHKCLGTGQKCPSRPFPGIWELVLNQLQTGVGNVKERGRGEKGGSVRGERKGRIERERKKEWEKGERERDGESGGVGRGLGKGK